MISVNKALQTVMKRKKYWRLHELQREVFDRFDIISTDGSISRRLREMVMVDSRRVKGRRDFDYYLV